jgi:hypothetical protein
LLPPPGCSTPTFVSLGKSIPAPKKKALSRQPSEPDVLRCDFCGKPQSEVRKLIAGPHVYICDECVEICVEIRGDEGVNVTIVPEPTVKNERIPDHTILWRRLDQAGHESARLSYRDFSWHLNGTSLFAHQLKPCRLDYLVICNRKWQTVFGRVNGWVGDRPINIEISADRSRRWQLNGKENPEVEGCIDLDLNFSPSTNLLPIRRLDLAVGNEANVRAAWLRFPAFTFEPLDQLYRRTDRATYHYESGGGAFVAELRVSEAGFVTHYSDFFEIVAPS